MNKITDAQLEIWRGVRDVPLTAYEKECLVSEVIDLRKELLLEIKTKQHWQDSSLELEREVVVLRKKKDEWKKAVSKREKYINELEWQNHELIEEMHSLSTALFDSDLSIGELETIRRRHISFMKNINNKTT